MENHPLYGKRKKKCAKCANPLFAQWLTEWSNAAAEKGIKSQYTYGKVKQISEQQLSTHYMQKHCPRKKCS